jgi:hypothetical protein
MIFTPEESREIAESMLGWEYEENVEYMEEGVDLELGWRTPTGGFYLEELGLPDFSQPEWTGAIQDALLDFGWKHNTLIEIRMSNNQGKRIQYVTATRFVKGVLSNKTQGFNGPYPKQLFDCWKYIKEASGVQP